VIKGDVILTSCFPDTDEKMGMLKDLLGQVRRTGIPVAITNHRPLPGEIIDLADYYFYDKEDILSENYTLYYHYSSGGLTMKTQRSGPYHSLAGWMAVKLAMTALRNKFHRLHYIQYDTLMRMPEYIEYVNRRLDNHGYVGSKYEVPDQRLLGIVATFFSFNLKWFDDRIPEINTWEEYKSYGIDQGDNLMGENWLYHLYGQQGILPECYFLSREESSRFLIAEKIQTRNDEEPGLVAHISELEDHRLILLVHLYNGQRKLNYTVNINGSVRNHTLEGGTIAWDIFDKTGFVDIMSKRQKIRFDIDPQKEYTETTFKFEDGKIRCLR
jgi:hypothetical protein